MSVDGRTATLTAKEFLLLEYLLQHRGRVLSRDLLLTDVWGYRYTGGTRTVDVTLLGDLPKGAVPDLSVDGTIELEQMNDVVYMGRPAFGQEQSTVGLFKILEDGVTAERTQVKLGKSSVNTVEVLSGLKVGDRVILSDMSQYDGFDRIRLK